jgi:hypothetical protein
MSPTCRRPAARLAGPARPGLRGALGRVGWRRCRTRPTAPTTGHDPAGSSPLSSATSRPVAATVSVSRRVGGGRSAVPRRLGGHDCRVALGWAPELRTGTSQRRVGRTTARAPVTCDIPLNGARTIQELLPIVVGLVLDHAAVRATVGANPRRRGSRDSRRCRRRRRDGRVRYEPGVPRDRHPARRIGFADRLIADLHPAPMSGRNRLEGRDDRRCRLARAQVP